MTSVTFVSKSHAVAWERWLLHSKQLFYKHLRFPADGSVGSWAGLVAKILSGSGTTRCAFCAVTALGRNDRRRIGA